MPLWQCFNIRNKVKKESLRNCIYKLIRKIISLNNKVGAIESFHNEDNKHNVERYRCFWRNLYRNGNIYWNMYRRMLKRGKFKNFKSLFIYVIFTPVCLLSLCCQFESLFIYLCGNIRMCILSKNLKINISLPESHQKALIKSFEAHI